MPIYEYECTGCGQTVEKIQKVDDPPLETCESCGEALRKRVSSPAIQFKGSGWYITDYSSKGKEARAREKAESPSSKAKTGGESGSTSEKNSGASGGKAGGSTGGDGTSGS